MSLIGNSCKVADFKCKYFKLCGKPCIKSLFLSKYNTSISL